MSVSLIDLPVGVSKVVGEAVKVDPNEYIRVVGAADSEVVEVSPGMVLVDVGEGAPAFTITNVSTCEFGRTAKHTEKEDKRDRAGSEQKGKGTQEKSSSITDQYFNCNT